MDESRLVAGDHDFLQLLDVCNHRTFLRFFLTLRPRIRRKSHDTK